MALKQKSRHHGPGYVFPKTDKSYAVEDFKQGLPESQGQAVTASLKQMVSRVDENAFQLVDYAEKFIARRDMHVRAINDLVLSMGPYLTASKAYATALMAYGNEVEEKVTHILAMRDIDKNTRTLNTAKEVVAVNDLKETAGLKPHLFCAEEDCLDEYEAAFKKQGQLKDTCTENYMKDLAANQYQGLGGNNYNPDDVGEKDLYFAFAPYFIELPPGHFMMKLAQGLEDDIAVDLVERDYETNKLKFTECSTAVEESVDAFRKALHAMNVMPGRPQPAPLKIGEADNLGL